MEKFILAVKNWFINLTAAQKRTLVLGCTAFFCVILTVVVLAALKVSGEPPAEGEKFSIISPIAPEDIFLPDEPDFIPGVLLEREQRTSWTEQDALEFWQNPLEDGGDKWREIIETTVDELLERVP